VFNLKGLAAFEQRRSAIREGTDRNQESIKVRSLILMIFSDRNHCVYNYI